MPITERKSLQGKRLYKCDSCERLAPWADGWCWYGSYRDLDDGKPVVITCADCPRPLMQSSG